MGIRLSIGALNAVADGLGSALAKGVVGIYSGPQPSSSNDAETGALLAWVTEGGGSFTSGDPTNGLSFGSAVDGAISMASGENWTGEILADGTMAWFRFYANVVVTGDSTTADRADGTIGTSRAEMIVPTTKATTGGSVTPTTFKLNFKVIN